MYCVEGTVAFGCLGRQALGRCHRRQAWGRLPLRCVVAAALRRHDLLQRSRGAGERCFYSLLRCRFCFRCLACGLPGGGAFFVAFDNVLEGRQVLREPRAWS